MKIGTWNVWRRRPSTPTGSKALEHLRSLSLDVAVLTEAWCDHLGEPWNHADGGESGIPRHHENERKVVIASRWPLKEVSTDLDAETPGRFVSALVDRPEGAFRVIGVCIPWSGSRVRSGTSKPWEDHLAFLESFRPILEQAEGEPCIVAGDFNQRVPRASQSRPAAESLERAFKLFDIVTSGVRPGTGKQMIDHIAVSRHFQVTESLEWSGTLSGTKLSDHDGVLVDLEIDCRTSCVDAT